MGDDDSQQQDDNAEAKARKDPEMPSLEDVERLVREDAEVRGKLVDKTPEQWQEFFDRVLEKLAREGPPKDDEWVLDEDARLAREYERLAREEEEGEDDDLV